MDLSACVSEERGHGEGGVVYPTLLSGSHTLFFFRVQAGVWLTIKQMQVRESPGPSVVLGKFVVLNLGR
jgi:hypothetical protein